MERPNTVSGLLEKRRELSAYLKNAMADVKRLTNDIDALDTVIRLFASDIDGRNMKARRLPAPFAARKGELQRTVLDTIRMANGAPVTSIMIAERFCASRGLAPDDRTMTTIRNRISGAIIKMRARGLVHEGASSGQYKGWLLAEEPQSE